MIGVRVESIDVPGVGGHAGAMILPAFSNILACTGAFDKHVQGAGAEFVNANVGAGSTKVSSTSAGTERDQLVHGWTGANAEPIVVPVAGGHAGAMSLPVPSKFPAYKSALDKHVRFAGRDLGTAKSGKGRSNVSLAFAGVEPKQSVQELTGANVESIEVPAAGG